MTRKEAHAVLGRQPKWALSNMCRALQLAPHWNTPEDWLRLEALKSLGFRVTIQLPNERRA